MIIKRFKQFLYELALKEKNPQVLALSVCIGVFIAFSPFVCFPGTDSFCKNRSGG